MSSRSQGEGSSVMDPGDRARLIPEDSGQGLSGSPGGSVVRTLRGSYYGCTWTPDRSEARTRARATGLPKRDAPASSTSSNRFHVIATLPNHALHLNSSQRFGNIKHGPFSPGRADSPGKALRFVESVELS
jgi:hypothetical protein